MLGLKHSIHNERGQIMMSEDLSFKMLNAEIRIFPLYFHKTENTNANEILDSDL